MNIQILPVDTGRAEDGLALSSRNAFLTADQRAEAPRLYHHLSRMKAAIEAGEKDYSKLAVQTVTDLRVRGWHDIDYVDTRNAETLKPASNTDQRLVILIAARLGSTRLIDNIEVN